LDEIVQRLARRELQTFTGAAAQAQPGTGGRPELCTGPFAPVGPERGRQPPAPSPQPVPYPQSAVLHFL